MQKVGNNLPKQHPNILFYEGSLKDPTYRLKISAYHDKRKDYQFLESKHAYVQWLFPNHYSSKFNYNSYPLTQHQGSEFRINTKIARNLILSYQMFCDFMGVRLKSIHTGSLQLINEQRLKNVLIKNTHNHLRIMRILACLSTVGFRHYAHNLIQFLEHTVTTPMFSSVRNTFESKWKVYEEDNKARQMCFLSDATLLNTRNVIFNDQKELESVQKQVDQLQNRDNKKGNDSI